MTVIRADFAAARRNRERDALDEMIDQGFDALREMRHRWRTKESTLLSELRCFSRTSDVRQCHELACRLVAHYERGMAMGFAPGFVGTCSPGDDWRPGA